MSPTDNMKNLSANFENINSMVDALKRISSANFLANSSTIIPYSNLGAGRFNFGWVP